ncbi:hypothetical protein N9M50_06690, partial [Alphaproteobacteria bacterium]|nr:hypothetical protein [Alphaproteobacteria bacterium]
GESSLAEESIVSMTSSSEDKPLPHAANTERRAGERPNTTPRLRGRREKLTGFVSKIKVICKTETSALTQGGGLICAITLPNGSVIIVYFASTTILSKQKFSTLFFSIAHSIFTFIKAHVAINKRQFKQNRLILNLYRNRKKRELTNG